MLSFEQRIRKTIEDNRLIFSDQSVVVGVSGGPDSICLLQVLTSLYSDLSIVCVYVDHNLRPNESVQERNLVEAYCRQISLDCNTVSVDVPGEVDATGESIEACARRLRYEALEEVRRSRNADVIAVGHTADDQVEEVLLRLIRGTGLTGLSGMRSRYGRVVRPLLEVTRQEILDYLQENRLEFCEDSSNQSNRFLRNRIRLELLPILEEHFNPSIRNTILTTAKILEVEEDNLSSECSELYSLLVEVSDAEDNSEDRSSITVGTEELSTLHRALRRRIIERLCWEAGSRPDFKIIDNIDTLLFEPSSGSELHLPKGVRIIRQHDSLLFTRLAADRGPRARLAQKTEVRRKISGPGSYFIDELGGQLEIRLADCHEAVDEKTMRLDADSVTFPLQLRSAEPGDRFTPLGGPGRKKVARFLSDKKVPHHLRPHYPLLDSSQGIICVLGQQIDKRCAVSDTTKSCVLIHWECI